MRARVLVVKRVPTWTWLSFLALASIPSPTVAASLEQRVRALEQRMAAVEQRVTATESALKPLNVTVDCAAGQTVGAALTQVAAHPRPVVINILGECSEGVTISRHDVTLQGGGLIRPTGGNTTVLSVGIGLRGIQLGNMTLTGGGRGLRIRSGSTVTAQNLTIQNSQGTFGGGLSLEWGGYLRIFGSTIRNHAWGGVFVSGGELDIAGVTIEDNGGAGIAGESGASLLIQSAIVRRNREGLSLSTGASAIGEENTVDDNTSSGAKLASGHLQMSLTSFSNNGADGVTARAGSSVDLNFATIGNNAGNGVRLRDTSVGTLGGANQITQNANYGVLCDPAPAVAQAAAFSVLDASTVFGNGVGQSNCPTNP